MSNTQTIPGKCIRFDLSHDVTDAAPNTTGTLTPRFDAIRKVLSDKPCRRPNRSRPEND